MLPSLMLFDSEPPQPGSRRPIKIVVVLGVAFSLLIGLLLVVLRSTSMMTVPVMIAVVSAIMIVLVALLVLRSPTGEKVKREIAAGDMYSLIDRMLPELDANERQYLRRRLEEIDAGTSKETPEELGALLDEHIRERRERR